IPALTRLFAVEASAPIRSRALRHLEARNDKFNNGAWMDVWTEFDGVVFRYDVVSEGGSKYIRSKVFMPALTAEREMWTSRSIDRAAISVDNYVFGECEREEAGLARVAVTPRRKDM